VVGTQFSVALEGEQTRVQLAQGKVQVRAGESPGVFLVPGQAVEYAANGPGAIHPFEPGRAFAWRQRQLVFSQQPLAEVVAELNDYYRSLGVSEENLIDVGDKRQQPDSALLPAAK
jgi:transmembrane sensor